MKHSEYIKKFLVCFFVSLIVFLPFLPLPTLAVSCVCNGAIEEYQTLKAGFVPIKQLNGVCIHSTPEKLLEDQGDCVEFIYDRVGKSLEDGTPTEVRFAGTCEVVTTCGNPDEEAGNLIKKLELRKPILEIIIPNLKLSEVQNTIDERGNIQIPWIGEYLKAIYRFAITIASIVGVVMIIKEGLRIILSAGGDEKITGYKHIGRVIAGLFLAWLSYVILYNINSDLVSFRALNIKLVQDSEYIEDDTQEQTSDEFKSFIQERKESNPLISIANYTPCTEWTSGTNSTFDCDKWRSNPQSIKACGVTPESDLRTITCGGKVKSLGGRADSLKIIPEMEKSLCKAIEIAERDGYNLRFVSSYRTFKTQADNWCGEKSHSGSRAAPGFSNHGRGQALDVYLFKGDQALTYDPQNKQKGGMFNAQCDIKEEHIKKLAEIFYEADKTNFKRLEKEIWHFEFGKTKSATGEYYSYPKKCGK